MYSFWHFDDFSWGNTRLVLGDDGQKKVLPADEGKFDPKSIPLKKWSDHENELWETGSAETKGTTITSSTTRRTAAGGLAPVVGYSPTNNGYMTPVVNYATSMNQMPITSTGSVIGEGGQLYNDNASFRYSHQNLAGRASSVVMGPPFVLNMATSQPLNLMSAPSIYSEGSVHGGGGIGFSSITNNNNGMMDNVYHPSDEEIRREVQRITATADLTTLTKKQVREQLSRHFGINMAYRKDFINNCIEEVLNF
jgi:chitin synthase